MKRIFIIKASKAITSPKFSMKNIAGSSGRLDVVCRCILNAFKVNGKIRTNTTFYAVLEGPPKPSKLIIVNGEKLINFPNNEIEVAKIIRDLLKIEEGEHSIFKGFSIMKMDFKKLIKNLKSQKNLELIYLHQNGKDIRKFNFNLNKNYAFILGDHIGLDPFSEKFLDSLKIPRISLGPVIYLSSQCIVIVHEELDRFIKSKLS